MDFFGWGEEGSGGECYWAGEGGPDAFDDASQE